MKTSIALVTLFSCLSTGLYPYSFLAISLSYFGTKLHCFTAGHFSKSHRQLRQVARASPPLLPDLRAGYQ
eukprot:5122272-Amphidinium_carterae.1